MLPLSIVMCTYNRDCYLKLALQSLTLQTLPVNQYELIIIDDGSTDRTSEVVEAFTRKLPIRYFKTENRGLAAAKNLGLELSCGEIVFFFDDDDAASPTLLEQHLRAHRKYPQNNYAVLNYTTWAPQLTVTFFMHFITEIDDHLFSYKLIKNGDILDYTYFWGGRSSCKKAFLNQNGNFNPVFRFGCEDIELGYRLSKHDFRVVYNANAVSYMTRPITLGDFLERLLKQGRSQAIFRRIHPCSEVKKWCEMDTIHEEWLYMEPVYELVLRSSLQLERITNTKSKLGIGVDAVTERLFYRALWNAFRATKVKGIMEGLQVKIGN